MLLCTQTLNAHLSPWSSRSAVVQIMMVLTRLCNAAVTSRRRPHKGNSERQHVWSRLNRYGLGCAVWLSSSISFSITTVTWPWNCHLRWALHGHQTLLTSRRHALRHVCLHLCHHDHHCRAMIARQKETGITFWIESATGLIITHGTHILGYVQMVEDWLGLLQDACHQWFEWSAK